jgi:hypothetical protein
MLIFQFKNYAMLEIFTRKFSIKKQMLFTLKSLECSGIKKPIFMLSKIADLILYLYLMFFKFNPHKKAPKKGLYLFTVFIKQKIYLIILYTAIDIIFKYINCILKGK